MDTLDGQAALILDALPLPAALIDRGGRLVRWNPSFDRHFRALSGFPASALTVPFLSFMEERQSRRIVSPFIEFLRSEERSLVIETPVKIHDESTAWIRLRMTRPIEGLGEEPLVLCIGDNITPQKAREEGLVSAKEEAERAIDAKSLFIANMSHELRTPIQTITGTLELLEETDLDREQAEYARQVRFSADVLLSLINDILDFSKIEAGKLELENIDFDLRSAIWQSADMIALEAQRKGLELIVDLEEGLPFLVKGDPVRLRQVIVNLVKNAVKFTRQGEVVVRARRGEGDEGSSVLLLEVADTGIGISREQRDRLFSPFYQADSSHTRRFGGTGLGLSISRRLIEALGGRIGVRPNEPEGSVFWFVVPISVVEENEPADPPRLEASLLLVDDNPAARDVEARMAAQAGLSVHCASSGAEALRMMAKREIAGESFDLCVIDQSMPVMDGWALASAIKAESPLSPTKLVLLSHEGAMGPDAKMKLRNHFSGYVTKPARPREFIQALSRALAPSPSPDAAEESVAEQEEASAAVAGSEGGSAGGRRFAVMVVEDHLVNQQLFKVILEKAGCEVWVAADGQEAVELNRQRPFDIVFMDIQMPRMNGHEATKAMRSEGARMPIIAVTAASTLEERETCLSSGMNDILLKPFRKNDIYGMLEFWTKRGSASIREEAAAEPSAESTFDDLEVFDYKTLVDTFLGKEELVVSLVSKFLERTKGQVMDMDAALRSGDMEALKREAHGLKGSAWNLQARRLGNAAKALEEAVASADGPRVDGAMENLREELFEFAQYAQYFVTSSC